ncbi:MAG: hypothetical protein DI589_18660 [Shinella sp.]|nr:MAG: hypothetical protein DI589_18660 [Shinella sp.]
MKILYILLMISLSAYSQSADKQVIYATSSKNVNLFFQSPITTAIVGSDTFSFGFNKEDKSTYGILKAISGQESNLLITTDNGNVFSFIIRYKKDITELNYFIDDSLAIGNTRARLQKINKDAAAESEIGSAEEKKVSKTVTVNDYEKDSKTDFYKKKSPQGVYDSNPEEYYKNICLREIEKERYFVRFYQSNSKVYLRLKNIFYDREELYFALIIDNNSNLDFDVEDLSFFITAKNSSRKTSTQRIAYEPIYIYEPPERIGGNSSKEIVYVFKKFSINSQKVLLVSLSEQKGERNINLEIPNSNINNPN